MLQTVRCVENASVLAWFVIVFATGGSIYKWGGANASWANANTPKTNWKNTIGKRDIHTVLVARCSLLGEYSSDGEFREVSAIAVRTAEWKYLFSINYKPKLGFDPRRMDRRHPIANVRTTFGQAHRYFVLFCFIDTNALYAMLDRNEDVILWVFRMHDIGSKVTGRSSRNREQHVPSNTLN